MVRSRLVQKFAIVAVLSAAAIAASVGGAVAATPSGTTSPATAMPAIAMPAIAMPAIAMPAIAMPAIAMPAIAMPAIAMRHAELLKAEPGKNDTVATSPKFIKLWFSESVQLAVTTIRVTGPANHAVPLGAVIMAPAAKSPVEYPVSETLKPGKYTVAWKAMATDGHPSSGTFTFVVRTAATKSAK
jgi:methionine-rich copper-binding protein CopC